MVTMDFDGPRSACVALDKLADEIAEPIVTVIKGMNISDIDKAALTAVVEESVMAPFLGDGTILKVRSYIHDLYREVPK